MKSQHTPGPWTAGEKQPDLDSDGNGYCWPVCALTKSQREKSIPGKDYVQNPDYCNSQANARLIAAAPELLAVVERLFYSINGLSATYAATTPDYACSRLRKEIAEAIRLSQIAISKSRGAE